MIANATGLLKPAEREKLALVRLRTPLLAAALFLASCGGDERPPPTTTIAPPSPSTTTADPVGAPPAISITPVATVDRPTALATRDGDESLYVAEKGGRIRAIRNGELVDQPVLDLSSEVSDDGERGLLGLAFAPESSKLYVNYTDRSGDTHITEFTMAAEGSVDIGSRRELLTVDQPFANHNGGQLAFGPDGHLYIGLGDGGGAGDPQKNAQNLTSLLGKILRINPKPSTDLPYTIPFDNPFVGKGSSRGEIWSYGLRNPWRFSFDPENKAMWIADVGQNQWEEINRVEYNPAGGENYGWPLREGTHRFIGEKPTSAIDPVYEYNHDGGACSVTGGHVYRGSNLPELKGRYVFGDFCTGQLSTLTLRGTEWLPDRLTPTVPTISGFGQDLDGELYVLSQNGQVGRIDPA